MADVTISAANFNKILKKLSGHVSSTVEIKLLFKIFKDKLVIYYKAPLDKSEVYAYFYEEIQCVKTEGEGEFSISSKDLLDLKVPDPIKEDRYPKSTEINIVFKETSLLIKYGIIWNISSSPSDVVFELAYTEKDNFSKFINILDKSTYSFTLDCIEFENGLNYCSFFKTDATASNLTGCFFAAKEDKFFLVSTDSNVAVQYTGSILDRKDKNNFEILFSTQAVKFIKAFIHDISVVDFSINKTYFVLDGISSKACIPLASFKDYPITNIDEFFRVTGGKVAKLLIAPIQTMAQTLSNRIQDLYRTLTLIFKNGHLTITANKDICNNIPVEGYLDCSICVNGDFLSSVLGRLSANYKETFLNFELDSSKLIIYTEDSRLVFLIQGQSEN